MLGMFSPTLLLYLVATRLGLRELLLLERYKAARTVSIKNPRLSLDLQPRQPNKLSSL